MSTENTVPWGQATQSEKLKVVCLEDRRAEDINWNECAQLYQSGVLGPALAEKYGCNIKTIYRRLRRMGVMRDTRGEAKYRANKMMSGSGLSSKALQKAIEEADGDEELGIDDALVENDAKRIAKVSLTDRRTLEKMIKGVNVFLDRMAEAEYTGTVKTKTGLVVLISASEEMKNCANILKTIIPLRRIVHGLDKGDAEDAARRAEAEAKKTNSAVQQVLDLLQQGKRVSVGSEDRLGRTG